MNAPLGALESLYYFILQYGGVEDESRLTTGQQKRGSLLLYYRAENESTYKCVLRSAFQHARKFPKTISPCVVLCCIIHGAVLCKFDPLKLNIIFREIHETNVLCIFQ